MYLFWNRFCSCCVSSHIALHLSPDGFGKSVMYYTLDTLHYSTSKICNNIALVRHYTVPDRLSIFNLKKSFHPHFFSAYQVVHSMPFHCIILQEESEMAKDQQMLSMKVYFAKKKRHGKIPALSDRFW